MGERLGDVGFFDVCSSRLSLILSFVTSGFGGDGCSGSFGRGIRLSSTPEK